MVTQSVASTSEGVIFVSKDAVIFSEGTTISGKMLMMVNSNSIEKKNEPQKVRTESGKKSLSKSLIKKKKTIIVAKNKPNRVFSDTPSNQDLQNEIGFAKNFFAPNQNPTFNSELTFHCRALNIPIFVHLEKKYTEEFSLSSEFSKALFSRPPPYESYI